MTENKRWIMTCRIILAAMIIITGIVGALLGFTECEWGYKAAFNISMLVSCLVICIIMYVSVVKDHMDDAGTRRFTIVIFTEFMLLFSAFLYWYNTVHPLGDLASTAAYYLEDIFYTLLLTMFFLYIETAPGTESAGLRRIRYAVLSMLALTAVMLFANIFTGFLFEIDDGEHTLGSLGIALIVPNVAIFLLSLASVLLYSKSLRTGTVMTVCLMFPMLILVVGYPSTLTYSYISIVISLYILYGSVFLDRGFAIARNQAEIAEQRIAMMASRIEPDFLEESLESIIALDGTPQEAKDAIRLFKAYLVQNVSTISQKNPIPIDSEMEHVEIYTTLEKLRFKNRLNVVFDLNDRSFSVPPMSVQVLVENAIKHGLTQREEGGTVTIRTEETEDFHIVSVVDDGVGFDINAPRDTSRSHIGMDSAKSRISEMVGGSLEIASEIGCGTTAVIRIPKN